MSATQDIVPQLWRKGRKLSAANFNETVNAVRRLIPGAHAPGIEASSGRIAVAQFEVHAEYDDYLECYRIDVFGNRQGETGSETLYVVAKPPLLRRTLWEADRRYAGTTYAIYDDGTYRRRTASRTVSGTTYTEDQFVSPPYLCDGTRTDGGDTEYRGDYLVAMQGVEGFPLTVQHDGVTTTAYWLDLNPDGRRWAVISA